MPSPASDPDPSLPPSAEAGPENEVLAAALGMALDGEDWAALRPVVDCVVALVAISGDNDATVSIEADGAGVSVTVKVTVAECGVGISDD